jgi:hypothetical protein
LPKDLRPEDPIDVYAVDRAYWDSFNFLPQAGQQVDVGGP